MEVIDRIKNVFSKGIGEPPWEYDFLVNLDLGVYPLYLKKIFKYKTGEDLPIKKVGKDQWIIDKNKCKTFNQKIQWIKLHGVTPLMRDLTDKVKVRDYVREKIGEEYLKPVLQIIPNDKSTPHTNPLPLDEGTNSKIQGFNQKMKADKLGGHPLPTGEGWGEGTALASKDVSTYFDQINWDKLPNSFVIKCNHGSKWQYIIKNKEDFLSTPQLVLAIKKQMTGWLEQEYFPWNGFEMQYKGIKPKILIEPLMRDEINTEPDKINVYCFNGKPKIFIKFFEENKMSIWDENFEPMDNIFNFSEENIKTKVDDYINQTFDLYNQLIKKMDFSFVRIDWMIYQNKPYFEEFTFTPFSGFHPSFSGRNKKLQSLII